MYTKYQPKLFILFIYLFIWLQDLSSPTRGQTHDPDSESTGVLTTGPPGNSHKPFNIRCDRYQITL